MKRTIRIGCVLLLLLYGPAACAEEKPEKPAAPEDRFSVMRQRMVSEDIAGRSWGSGSITSEAVIRAMGKVHRHEFVPEAYREEAYADHPLPIGHGQTISQPFIVAAMTQLLEPGKEDRVLEIGTGSGYQAAVLAGIAREVYTIEIIPELAEKAAGVLKKLNYENVHVRTGDGYKGWPEKAPFDGIMVTAAPDEVPRPLIDQLKPGGRMVIPVGPVHGLQYLKVLIKEKDGKLREKSVMPVRFVPFVREEKGE